MENQFSPVFNYWPVYEETKHILVLNKMFFLNIRNVNFLNGFPYLIESFTNNAMMSQWVPQWCIHWLILSCVIWEDLCIKIFLSVLGWTKNFHLFNQLRMLKNLRNILRRTQKHWKFFKLKDTVHCLDNRISCKKKKNSKT